MKRVLIILTFIILLGLALVAPTVKEADAVTFDGVYLVGSTSMTTDGVRLYISENVKTGTDRIRSSVRVFTTDSSVTEVGSASFQGEIKRIRYGNNKLFLHIGDTFYCCDVYAGLSNVSFGEPVSIYVYEGLITFDVYGDKLYTLFERNNAFFTNVCSINDLPASGSFPEGTIAGVDNAIDICAQSNYLYILDASGAVKFSANGVDNIFSNINYDSHTPTRLVRCVSDTAVSDGTRLWILPSSVSGASVYTELSANGTPLSIVDSVILNGKLLFLDISETNGRIDVKEFELQNGTAVYKGVLLGNNAVMGELPEFLNTTFSDNIKSAYYELAYTVAYPSNIVYTISEKNPDLHLEGTTLTETDTLLLIDRSHDSEFVLVLYDGKLGYIKYDEQAVNIVSASFSKPQDPTRYSANQTFSVYSLPSTAAKGHYLTSFFSNAINRPIRVSLLYTLVGYDSPTEKWGYIAYSDDGGVLRYGFALLGDMRSPSDAETVYTIMRANPDYGTKLNLYNVASPSAEAITTIDSGDTVNVYNYVKDSMSYVSVSKNGSLLYGYVFSNQLANKDELTRNESLAIVCAFVIVVLIVGCICFVVYNTKKHKKQREDLSNQPPTE